MKNVAKVKVINEAFVKKFPSTPNSEYTQMKLLLTGFSFEEQSFLNSDLMFWNFLCVITIFIISKCFELTVDTHHFEMRQSN